MAAAKSVSNERDARASHNHRDATPSVEGAITAHSRRRSKMKKLMMGIAAIVATSFAVPAFAQEAPKAEGEKKEHKGKKGHKKEKKEEAKPAEGGAK
jgi:hypothetical protein